MATDQCISPFPAEIDREAFGHWLSGFADGEGTFSIYCGESTFGGYRTRHYSVDFRLGLRDDDTDILRLIQRYWQCGIIDPRKQYGPKFYNPQILFRCRMVEDLVKVLIPHFHRYPLRAKKRADFLIWEQAVELVWEVMRRPFASRGPGGGRGSLPRWSESEHARFCSLANAIKAQRKYQAPAARTPPRYS